MKAILFTILILSCLVSSISSQSVSGVQLIELDAEYIRIEMRGMKNNKITVDLDFGQYDEPLNWKDLLIMDIDDHPMQFYSMIDALNFMTKYNYELYKIETHSTDSSSKSSYILRRRDKK